MERSQLRAARQSFGELPVVVLVRGVNPYAVPGQPQSEGNKAVEAANLQLMTEVARASSKGEVQDVAGAGHVVEETHPEAVVAAVGRVVGAIRK